MTPDTTTIITEVDLLEGAAVCSDVTCACELVFGEPGTDDDESRLLWWMWGPCERGRA